VSFLIEIDTYQYLDYSPRRCGFILASMRADELAIATEVEALARDTMTLESHFRRDHFPAPRLDRGTWQLEVDGAVQNPLRLGLDDLERAGSVTARVVLECAGHRRTEQQPAAPGVPWGIGAVGELRWTGIPLADLLHRAGIGPGALTVVLEGSDRGSVPSSGEIEPFARALPLEKALADETLVCWAAEDEPIPAERGGPVRVVVPGWYATDSVKWLTRITVQEHPFTGHFELLDYRLADIGSEAIGERLSVLPIHALLLDPRPKSPVHSGVRSLHGIAWGGEGRVARVDVQLDTGAWQRASLGPDRGRYARRFWSIDLNLGRGRHRILVRATDTCGGRQPLRHRPNRDGYAVHTVQATHLSVI
jgi:DMSO/TMAO reductase YedYZ molybdopterin-dependent catalytic subunit